jgi:separase
VAFAGLRALAGSKSNAVELPALQLENGMSVLVGKLVALGLDDLALKELRILKRRLETLGQPKKGPGSRTATATISQTLGELLDFGDASFTGAKLGLVITSQLQVLRLMASARNPKQVEEALPVLDSKHSSSPTRLLLLAAKESKDRKQSDKLARQLQTLSEILLSLGPSILTAEDALAQETKISVTPQAAFRIQCLALYNRSLWWGLAGHKGELSKDIFEPFLRCLQAFTRRSQVGALETYRLASSLLKDLQKLLDDCSYSQPRALKSTLQGIYRLLSSLSRDADIITDAIKWTERMQELLDPGLDSEAKYCAVNARMVSLKLRKGSWDSKDEELLLGLLDGLERPFKGTSDVDELMLEVSSARRFAINALSKPSSHLESEFKEQPASGMREMCEQLIFLCPRLCLRYLGNPPQVTSATKDVVRYAQRREFIVKLAFHAIDSVLYLVKVVLGEGRSTWELVDSKLQDCLLLLDRVLTDVLLEDSTAPTSYYTRISNLYYSQFLDMRKISDAKDAQQVRALRRSLDSIRGRPQKERKAAHFSTKLERMAEFCKATGRYDELHKTLLALRDEMIEDGVLSRIAENASSRPIRSLWDADDESATLGKTIQSILKVHVKYLNPTSRPSFADVSWSNEERGIVLEHQLDVLAEQNYSASIASLQVDVFQELLAIYDVKTYPMRRFRVLLRLLLLEQDKHETLCQYVEELEPLETYAIHSVGSRDEGLQNYLAHFQTLTATVIELRKARPNVEILKQSIGNWSSIRSRCKDFLTFQHHIDDVPDLLAQLEITANWLQMKGYGTVRVTALQLKADIYELCDDHSNPDDLVTSFTDLGSQWLQLGYSGKAGLALDRAKAYSNRNGVSAYALLQFHLSYCDYWIAIGNTDKV